MMKIHLNACCIVVCTIFSFFALPVSADNEKIKVACVGNSITYGTGVQNREQNAYPVRLQKMLGNRYEVRNFGKPGATLLACGHRPYIQQKEFEEALAFAADIVVIHLGVNDTDPRNWPNYRDDFIGDYRNMLNDFRKSNPNTRFLIARMSPLSDRHWRFESGTRDWHQEIQQAIEKVAKSENVQLIDFHAPLYALPYLIEDGIHPNAEGAAVLAKVVYEGITGEFGGLQMSHMYSDNMVLQHGVPLKIGGKADAGEQITVYIDNQKRKAVATTDGKWHVVLDPLNVGGPYTLRVVSDSKTLKYENVMAGDVWLCSGQSNMEFGLSLCATGKRDIPNAVNKDIRLYDMKARWRTNAVEWNATVLDSLNHLQYFKDTEWEECTPQSASQFSAVAYYFGKMLQDSLDIPIGLICNAVGGSPAEAWIDRRTLEYEFPAILRNWTRNDFIQDWVRERASLNVKKSANPHQRHPYEPCYLYESGVRPMEQFPIKGVIWYQGESNAHNKDAHEKLFRLLVQSWRNNWNNAKMPFYFVQLSSMDRPSWTWFRDSQRLLMNKVPYSGMAVCTDCGDSLDVHPTRKQEVGERLAYWALNKTYFRMNVIPSGPLYKSVFFQQNMAYISFDYAKGLHAGDNGELLCFEIAGEDGVFYPAKATIEGEQVRAWSDKVNAPRIVRYGWQPYTRANLVNCAGLPASTFRTDTK
ncbi:MAG: sialate O-acetylesterase [Bacteroidaceae bacterium]|nr:sialate O-acetylesterase [Bacteroidaceae bacterium]